MMESERIFESEISFIHERLTPVVAETRKVTPLSVRL